MKYIFLQASISIRSNIQNNSLITVTLIRFKENMTETFSCELWLVLKCDLMGFCNLMYYKPDANFHRFIFLHFLFQQYCRKNKAFASNQKESRNMKIFWTVLLAFIISKFMMHALIMQIELIFRAQKCPPYFCFRK